jgi:hypothetical protein
MTSGNGGLVYHEDAGVVEAVYSSRYAAADGLGSIYQSVATPEMVKAGSFGDPVRIATGPSARDFGYAPLVRTSTGMVIAMWYTGSETSSAIMMMRGYRDGRKPKRNPSRLVDENTGRDRITPGEDGSRIGTATDLRSRRSVEPSSVMWRLGHLRLTKTTQIVVGTTSPQVSPPSATATLYDVDVASIVPDAAIPEDVAGYLVEVTYEFTPASSTSEMLIEFGTYSDEIFPGRIIARPGQTTAPFRQTQQITIPCRTDPRGGRGPGSFMFRVSTVPSYFRVRIVGYYERD